jgi:hypothetical protein
MILNDQLVLKAAAYFEGFASASIFAGAITVYLTSYGKGLLDAYD